MKLGYKLLAAVAGIMALSSCVQEAIGPLTGVYEKPATYELNTVKDQSVVKGEGTRTFNVTLANETATLAMKFVGDKYYLADGGYTASPEAKKGTYLVGNGGSTFTVNGNAVNVDSGTLTVTNNEGNYTFTGMLWLADESVVEIKAAAKLVYEADPEPVVLKNVISATSNVASGTNSVTINLATADVTATYDAATWSNVFSGTGNYLALDIYSADGYLHEGTYTACAVGGTIAEGEFGIGWDPGDIFNMGMMFENWGTCWWDVNNGAVAINQKVTEGTVTVTRKGSKWVIELVSGEGKSMLWTKFEGAIDALTNPSESAPVAEYTFTDELGDAVDMTTYQPIAGLKTHTLRLFKGEEPAVVFYIIAKEGDDIAGTYKCQENAAEAGLMGNGWDASFMNWGDQGSYYYENGKAVYINAGETLTIEKLGEGIYSFDCSTGHSFVAAAEGANIGGGDNNGGSADVVELSSFLSLTSYLGYGINMVGVELGTAGFSYSYDMTTYKPVYSGDGNYLKLEVYSTDGTIAPGTYTACAVGGTVGEGEFGIGYDGMFGASGTSWYTVAGGTATYEYITDGTVTVEVSGDEYTITIESSVVNAQFVGAFAQ